MTIKHAWLRSGLIIGILLSAHINVFAEDTLSTSYLVNDAPTFAQTVEQFEQTYNAAHPDYQIPPYKEIVQLGKESTLYFASRINDTLYSSVVVDNQTKKIKSLQLTYIAPVVTQAEPDVTTKDKAAIATPEDQAIVIDGNNLITTSSDEAAYGYMAALLDWFNPKWSPEESKKELERLLSVGRDEPLYQEIIDNLRYVVVDRGEKGITLAVEPIKQKILEPEESAKD